MRNENEKYTEWINKLYRRARREQTKYRKQLIEQKPADILFSAEKYVIRKKILKELCYAIDGRNHFPQAITIPASQLTALLRSRTPLADICEEFFSDTELYGESDVRRNIQSSILNCGNDILRQEFLERKRKCDFSYHDDRSILTDDEFDELYYDELEDIY